MKLVLLFSVLFSAQAFAGVLTCTGLTDDGATLTISITTNANETAASGAVAMINEVPLLTLRSNEVIVENGYSEGVRRTWIQSANPTEEASLTLFIQHSDLRAFGGITVNGVEHGSSEMTCTR